MSTEQTSGRNWGFAPTRWSMVLAAQGSTPEGKAALSTLCGLYWRPLYVYLRRRGYSVEDAQDLTQSYFSRLMEKDFLGQVDSGRGKFRSFLLASLKNFIANEWDREHAQKRGGGIQFLSWEEMDGAEGQYAENEQLSSLTPEQLYERSWVLTLLDRVARRLADEFAKAGKSAVFDKLKPFLIGDIGTRNYADIAAALSMSQVAVRVAVHRMRGRFRDLLHAEIAETVANPEDPREIEDEIRHLLTVL